MNDFIKKLINGNQMSYQRQQPVVPQVSSDDLIKALHEIESSGGKDPNTAPNIKRSYRIPGANKNEKDRYVDYQVGYGGQYGLTPDGIASIAKSGIDRNSPQNANGYTGFVPGQATSSIQSNLITSPETAGLTARDVFMKNKASSTDMTVPTLTNDYMDKYMTKGSPLYTPQNRARVQGVFNKYAK